jgi:hydrogenase maturation protein HypF
MVITGRVQGVGFRPFVYVTAQRLGITGSVLNGSGKVYVHAEGDAARLDQLEKELISLAPPLARPTLALSEAARPCDSKAFEILASTQTAEAEIHVPPDLYTCDECFEELIDPGERRHGYPFINCTQCGPRYTIITAMPYDRPNTSMAGFPLCEDCRAEYESPVDRRFHAQPLACAVCGPGLEYAKSTSPAHDLPPVGARHARAPSAIAETAGGSHQNFRAHGALPQEGPEDGGSSRRDRAHGALPQEGPEDGDFSHRDRAHGALLQAIRGLRDGLILAIKGVGGYHLVCDAGNDHAVRRLRGHKHRPDKPLAVMFPLAGEDGLAVVRRYLIPDETTAKAITDPSRPIVLIPKRHSCDLSPALAPGLAELGAFLPYSPLHHQLLRGFDGPVVATSGNISGEPVITDPTEAEQRLAGVADAFLHHNRPIVRPADDSVIRPMAGKTRVIRLGRGIAPLERRLPKKRKQAVLALGGHMKVTVALAWEDRVVISPHVGEMDSKRSRDVFVQVINDIQNIYKVDAEKMVCDLHPGYATTRWAQQQGLPVIQVQHHAAHASSLSGEHPDVDRWLVFTWDGVGIGGDGSLWGGEAFIGCPGQWVRRASFRPFSLVGGDKAGREPWRSAAALMWAEGRDWQPASHSPIHSFPADAENPDFDRSLFSSETHRINPAGVGLVRQAWQSNSNTFMTSAVGRLFDAASALVLGRYLASFEGQGPMELEQFASSEAKSVNLPLERDNSGLFRTDWSPLLPFLSNESVPAEIRASLFHASMAEALVQQALRIRREYDFEKVGLSGGVFQNRLLTEMVIHRLERHGIEVCLHEKIPANDGGLCFGQVIETM